jgi:hypothetical protein
VDTFDNPVTIKKIAAGNTVTIATTDSQNYRRRFKHRNFNRQQSNTDLSRPPAQTYGVLKTRLYPN